MSDFFKPWRKKIGVVTLVLACAFAVGWVRSFSRSDGMQWDAGAMDVYVNSHDNHIYFSFETYDKPFRWTLPEIWSADYMSFRNPVGCDHRGFCLLCLAGIRFHVDAAPWFVTVPYATITILLSLLSANLLLSQRPDHQNSERLSNPFQKWWRESCGNS